MEYTPFLEEVNMKTLLFCQNKYMCKVHGERPFADIEIEGKPFCALCVRNLLESRIGTMEKIVNEEVKQ